MLVPSLIGCGVIKGDTVMRLGDYKITEAMYSYWTASYKTLFLSTYNNSRETESFWSEKVDDDTTYEDFLNELIYDHAKKVLVSMKLFDDYALTISSDTKKAISKYIDVLIDSYGSRSELNSYLGGYGLNIKTLEYIYYAEQKAEVVSSYLFGTSGPYAVTDTDKEKYYTDNYYCVDWIYVYTENKPQKGEDGGYVVDKQGSYVMDALTDEEKEAQAKKVAEIKAEINAGKSFSALKSQYDEYEVENAELISNINVSPNDIFDGESGYAIGFLKTMMSLEIGSGCGEYFDGDGTYIIIRKELASFAELSDNDLYMMKDFETYVLDDKAGKFYDAEEVTVMRDVIERYDIKTLKGLTNTNI